MVNREIDAILQKPASERTDDEIEKVITWQVEQRLREESYRREVEEARKINQELLQAERAMLAENARKMEEMVDKAIERLEYYSNEQA